MALYSKVKIFAALVALYCCIQCCWSQTPLVPNQDSASFSLTSAQNFVISIPRNAEFSVLLRTNSIATASVSVSRTNGGVSDFSVGTNTAVPAPFSSVTDSSSTTYYLRASCSLFCTTASFVLRVDIYSFVMFLFIIHSS